MADRKSVKRNLPDAAGMGCEEWVICLAEAIDGRLTDQVAPLFERHRASCEACGSMMEEARQGLAWLDLVKEEPEPPSDLLQAILARTGPRAASPPQSAGLPVLTSPAAPQPAAPQWSAWRGAPPVRRWFESRAMMTVAMGIFSLAVTLRAASASPAVVSLAEAQPGELSAILSRPYFAAHERIAKYCENLKMVREMEVGLRDIKESDKPSDARPSENRPAAVPRGGHIDGVNGMQLLRESLERENLALQRGPGFTPRRGNREGDSSAEKRGA